MWFLSLVTSALRPVHELIRGNLAPIIILFLLPLDVRGKGAVRGSLVATEQVGKEVMGRLIACMKGVKERPDMVVKLDDVRVD